MCRGTLHHPQTQCIWRGGLERCAEIFIAGGNSASRRPQYTITWNLKSWNSCSFPEKWLGFPNTRASMIPAAGFTAMFAFSADLLVRVPPDHLFRVQEVPCAFASILSSVFTLLSHRNSFDPSFT